MPPALHHLRLLLLSGTLLFTAVAAAPAALAQETPIDTTEAAPDMEPAEEILDAGEAPGTLPPLPVQPTAPARDTVAVTVEEAILRALNLSPDIKVVQADEAFAEARLGLARSSRFLTEFNLTTGHSFAPGLRIPEDNPFPPEALYLNPYVRDEWDKVRPLNRYEVSALQPLFTWGQLGGSIRAARYGVGVERAAVDEKQMEVALRTGELYYGYLLARSLGGVAERAGGVVQRAKTEISRLLEEGAPDVDEADRYQVLITEQEYNRRVVEVAERLRTAEVAFTRQLFLPEGALAVPADALLEPLPLAADSLGAYLDLALANRPELERARNGLAAREALLSVARSDYYPKLFLSARTGQSFVSGRFRQPSPYISDPYVGRSLIAGVGFRLNLNYAQTRARVEQARAERNEVGFQLQGAEQLILFDVEQAYRNFLIARAGLTSREEALRLSREWLQSESVNFDLDLGDTENLVDAVRVSLELEAGYYESVYQYNLAVLRLLDAAGLLTDRAQSGTLVE